MTGTLGAKVRQWMFEEALPFWAEHGIDRVHGGYTEYLALDGSSGGAGFKRTRVTCRQIYVFSHAALLGWEGSLALARHGYAFLTQRTWLGPDNGWARLLDRRGGVKDPTPDLYDVAFVLFALGWFHRATGDPSALDWALRTLDFLDRHMRHPGGGPGFLSRKPAAGPRLQNPHMHLLEAALVHVETSGEARFRALADEMADLFSTRLFDPATQTLGEYFDEDWMPAAGDAGQITEPGHQFEWAWILAGYQRAAGRDMAGYARALVDFAERHGVDPETGFTVNAVRRDGTVLDRGTRTWPNTERIQAAAAMFELGGRDPRPVFEHAGGLLFERFLAHRPRGTWIDSFDGRGAATAGTIPASTLYHLFIAFSEMLRVEGAVRQAFP